MKYYATIDAEGRRTGTYREGQPNVPEGAIEIDKATLEAWIRNDQTLRWDRETGKLVECEPPVRVPTWDEIRVRRNDLLRQSDWTQLPDAPADKAAWEAYRQALRDIPQTYADPAAVAWPKAPE